MRYETFTYPNFASETYTQTQLITSIKLKITLNIRQGLPLFPTTQWNLDYLPLLEDQFVL